MPGFEPLPVALLSPDELALLRVVAAQLAAVPERENAMAAQVGADLTRLAHAADAGPEALRLVLLRFPWDDCVEHLAYAATLAAVQGDPAAARVRRAACDVLVRLKAA